MNWKTVIAELMNAGVSQVRIAEICGTSQGYISDLYRGRRRGIGYDLGRKLEDLHRETTQKTAA